MPVRSLLAAREVWAWVLNYARLPKAHQEATPRRWASLSRDGLPPSFRTAIVNLGTDGTLHRFIMSMLCLGPTGEKGQVRFSRSAKVVPGTIPPLAPFRPQGQPLFNELVSCPVQAWFGGSLTHILRLQVVVNFASLCKRNKSWIIGVEVEGNGTRGRNVTQVYYVHAVPGAIRKRKNNL